MKKLISVCAAVLLVGCASVEKQSFNKAANNNLKSITIIDPKPSTGFGVSVMNHPALGFGLIGASIYAAEMASKSNTLDTALKPFSWSLTDELAKRVAAGLTDKGYDVKRISVTRELTLIKDYAALKADPQFAAAMGADAILDLATRDPLYVANGPTADYVPSLVLTARLVSGKDYTLLYREDIMYGYAFKVPGSLEPVLFPAPEKFRFQNMESLTKDPKVTFEGISEGLTPVVNRVVSDLSKQ